MFKDKIKDKSRDKLIYYQCALAVGFVFVFFTNFDTYLYYAIAAPNPKNWIAIFTVFSIPLFLSFQSRKKYLPGAVIVWLYGYLAMSLVSFLLFAHDEPVIAFEELRTRILSVFFIFMGLFIFSKHLLVQLWTRRAILLVTIINVFATIYGLFQPEKFVTIVESQSILATGRPAGFYVDANRAGCVLVIGMIFGIGLLPRKYRLLLVLLVIPGIFVTFSRSAILCLVAALVTLVIKREISYKQLFLWIALLVVGLIMFSAIGTGLDLGNLETNGLLNNNTLERLTQFQSPTGVKELDESALSRIAIVEITWQKILESPFLGCGIGYGLVLAEMHPELGNIESHNMYLSLMLEHGFIGAAMFPLLTFVSTQKAIGENQAISLAFAALVSIWGFFSHNILEHREFLMIFAFLSAMNTTDSIGRTSQRLLSNSVNASQP